MFTFQSEEKRFHFTCCFWISIVKLDWTNGSSNQRTRPSFVFVFSWKLIFAFSNNLKFGSCTKNKTNFLFEAIRCFYRATRRNSHRIGRRRFCSDIEDFLPCFVVFSGRRRETKSIFYCFFFLFGVAETRKFSLLADDDDDDSSITMPIFMMTNIT